MTVELGGCDATAAASCNARSEVNCEGLRDGNMANNVQAEEDKPGYEAATDAAVRAGVDAVDDEEEEDEDEPRTFAAIASDELIHEKADD